MQQVASGQGEVTRRFASSSGRASRQDARLVRVERVETLKPLGLSQRGIPVPFTPARDPDVNMMRQVLLGCSHEGTRRFASSGEEAAGRIEPACPVFQTVTSPLGHRLVLSPWPEPALKERASDSN